MNDKENNVVKSHALPTETGIVTKTRTYNSSWSIMKGMVLFFGIISAIFVGATLLFSFQSNQIAQQRAFIVTNQGTIIASLSSNDIRSREIEVRNHVSLFMTSMYAFDERNFEKNIETGLNLIGDDGALILAEYRKSKIQEELIKTNGIVSIKVDSIWTSMNTEPFKARVFAHQKYETSITSQENILWADMYLKNVSRSEKNVHGLLIEDFNIIKNETVIK